MFSDFLYILEKKLYQLLREAFVALFFKVYTPTMF